MRRLTGADAVTLWEHDARGEVVATATSGPASPPDATGPPAQAHTEPVRSADRLHGLLAIVWSEPQAPLTPAVRNTVRVLAGSAARAIEHDERVAALERDARVDRLTGLPSARAWREALERELARAARGGEPPCVAVLAFDGERDDPSADGLLRQASTRWRARVRGGDVLARLDGARFGLLLPATALGAGRAVAQRLADSAPGARRVSVGVAHAGDGERPEELLERAEAARPTAPRRARSA